MIFVYSAFVFVCFSSVFRLFGWIFRLFGYFAYSASSKVHAGLFGHSGKTNVFFHLPVGRGLGRISNEYHFWKTRVSGITFYACINFAYNVAKNAYNDLYACLRYLCMFIFWKYFLGRPICVWKSIFFWRPKCWTSKPLFLDAQFFWTSKKNDVHNFCWASIFWMSIFFVGRPNFFLACVFGNVQHFFGTSK